MIRDLILRPATPDDAAAVAEVYLASRRSLASVPFVHTDDETWEWIARVVMTKFHVTVAAEGGTIVGMLATSHGETTHWVEHLYVHPAATGQGIGTRLLAEAMRDLGPPIRLHTFQCNEGARRFYEGHGFRAIAFGDGSANEERCPDVLYEYRLVPPQNAGLEVVR